MFEDEDIKSQVMELWRICFPEDTEEFIHFYFEKKFKQENTLISRMDDKIIASLQLLPYTITFYNTELNTSYVSGACTHPSFRSKGTMGELLKESFLQMIQKKVAIVTLIPANRKLFGYYGKFGFSTVFDYREEFYTKEYFSGKIITTSQYTVSEESPSASEIYSYFNKKEHERPFSIIHTENELGIIIEDTLLNQGKIFVIRNRFSRHICGLAFVELAEKKAVIKEMMTDGEGEKHLLLVSIVEKYENLENITVRSLPCAEPRKHLGMARIINVSQVLSIYAGNHPEVSFYIEITDPEIETNQGIFFINQGKCIKIYQENINKITFKFSIEQFTQVILGYSAGYPDPVKEFFPVSTPYMSLMLN
jgi:predicted acetyltransferase